MNTLCITHVIGLALSLGTALPVIAGEGHDHGPSPVSAVAPAAPRFVARTESFELVGVLDGKRLTLYLDQTDTNAPIKEAHIELDIGGHTMTAEKHGDDTFSVTLPAVPEDERVPVTATIEAAGQIDLLAAEWQSGDHTHTHDSHALSASWRPMAASLGLLGLLAVVGWRGRHGVVRVLGRRKGAI